MRLHASARAAAVAFAALLACPASALARGGERDRRLPFPEELAEERPEDAGPGLGDEVAAYLGYADRPGFALPWREYALADPALRALGDWEAGFVVSELLLHDDNVDLADRDQEGDYVSRTLLAATFLREGATVATEVSAALEAEGFARDGSRNGGGGHLRAGLVWDLRPAFLRVRDELTTRRDSLALASGSGAVEASGSARVRRVTNVAGFVLGLRPEPTGVEIGCSLESRSHGRGFRDLDARVHTVTAGATHAVSPKLVAGVQVERSVVDYTHRDGAASSGWTVAGTAALDVSEKTRVTARLGWTGTRGTDTAGTTRGSTATGGITAVWRATVKTSLEAGLTREVLASDLGTSQVADRIHVGTHWQISGPWSADVSASLQRSDPSAGGSSLYAITTLHVGYQVREGVVLALLYDRLARRGDDPGQGFRAQRIGVQCSVGF